MNRLLKLLADGHFHSGEELGALLGISRSAVWKYLQRLECEHDVRLFKVPGKGYRLEEPLSVLNPEQLTAAMTRIGWGVRLLEAVDSTNAEALRLLRSGMAAPFVVLAEVQTDGRGRRGREWKSPAARSIYYTLAMKVSGGPQALSGLSLVIGLAVCRALQGFGVSGCGLKWPNDIYVENKKISGILLELSGDLSDECHVSIGIGINVNMAIGSADIDQPWTSVSQQVGRTVDRNELIILVSEALAHYLKQHAEGGFQMLRSEWEANNIWRNRRCTLSTGTHQISGTMIGVTDQGALRLTVDGLGERSFNGGELSLRLDNDS